MKRRTGIQDAVYITYAFDCSELNKKRHEAWSELRSANVRLPDLRNKADRDRFWSLTQKYVCARSWMAVRRQAARRQAARRGPDRKLMMEVA